MIKGKLTKINTKTKLIADSWYGKFEVLPAISKELVFIAEANHSQAEFEILRPGKVEDMGFQDGNRKYQIGNYTYLFEAK